MVKQSEKYILNTKLYNLYCAVISAFMITDLNISREFFVSKIKCRFAIVVCFFVMLF